MKKLFLAFFLFFITVNNLLASPVISKQHVEKKSLLFLNGKINMMQRASLPSQDASLEMWLAVDCKDKKFWTLYTDTYKKGVFSGRIYGLNDSLNRYVPPKAQETEVLQINKNYLAEQLIAAQRICRDIHQFRPESNWIIVEKIEKPYSENGYMILIDSNNSEWIEKDLIQLRLAYDYNRLAYDPPYDAPYTMKVEDTLVNCSTKQKRIIVGFDVDEKGFVSDHSFNEKEEFTPIKDPQDRESILGLCKIDNFKEYSGQGKPTVRTKQNSSTWKPMLPDFSGNRSDSIDSFPLPEAIQKQAEALLQHDGLKAKFKRLTYTQKQGNASGTITIDQDKNGLTRTLEHAFLNVETQSISIANFFTEKYWLSFSPSPSIAQTLNTNLLFPLKTKQSFNAEIYLKNAADSNSIVKYFDCEIGESLPANSLHPNLPGNYWHIDCIVKGELLPKKQKINYQNNYAYLEELGIFIEIGRKTSEGMQSWPITNLVLER